MAPRLKCNKYVVDCGFCVPKTVCKGSWECLLDVSTSKSIACLECTLRVEVGLLNSSPVGTVLIDSETVHCSPELMGQLKWIWIRIELIEITNLIRLVLIEV